MTAAQTSAPARDTQRAVTRSGAVIRHDLQGLRAVAVLGVVVYHLRAGWLPGGFAGVDVFFVLSGYFITGLLLREVDRHGNVDLLAFWGRRARRLLPASLLVLVTTVLAGIAMTNPLEAHRIARDGVYATFFGMNWHEAASGLAYGQDPNPSPFQHYWSLGVEEQFYLAWPLLLLGLAFVWRWRRSASPRRILVGVGLIAGVCSFALALHQTAADQPYAYYGTFERVWQLALGGVLATLSLPLHKVPGWLADGSRIVGLGVIVAFYAAAPSTSMYPGWYALLPAVGSALVVFAGDPVHRREPVSALLASRLGQLGGKYSYSWYLWHWAPLVLLPIALDRPLRIRELGWCALGTLAAAVLTYHLLEDPIRRSRWLAHRHGGRSLQLAAVLMTVAVAVSLWTAADAQHSAASAHVVTASRQTLNPQPAAAVKDLPQVSTDGCQLPMPDPGFAPECRYLPNTGHGDVVLVGDSHAGMWFPAVRKVAAENSWGLRVWGRTSCPFADVRKAVSGTSEYVNCDRWRENVITRLIAERPSLVIVASYVQSGLHVTDPKTGRGASQVRAHELFQAGLERNLRRLRSAGLNVLVLRDVPGFSTSAPDCALAHEHDLSACSLPESQAIPYGGVDRKAAEAVAAVHLADFTNDFCHGGRCYQVVGNILAYRDKDHLTTVMCLSLAGQLNVFAKAAV